jgi:hypothetical protein
LERQRRKRVRTDQKRLFFTGPYIKPVSRRGLAVRAKDKTVGVKPTPDEEDEEDADDEVDPLEDP